MGYSGKAIITPVDKDNAPVGEPIVREYSDLKPVEIQAFFDGLVVEFDAKAADPTDNIERFSIVGA